MARRFAYHPRSCYVAEKGPKLKLERRQQPPETMPNGVAIHAYDYSDRLKTYKRYRTAVFNGYVVAESIHARLPSGASFIRHWVVDDETSVTEFADDEDLWLRRVQLIQTPDL